MAWQADEKLGNHSLVVASIEDVRAACNKTIKDIDRVREERGEEKIQKFIKWRQEQWGCLLWWLWPPRWFWKKPDPLTREEAIAAIKKMMEDYAKNSDGMGSWDSFEAFRLVNEYEYPDDSHSRQYDICVRILAMCDKSVSPYLFLSREDCEWIGML